MKLFKNCWMNNIIHDAIISSKKEPPDCFVTMEAICYRLSSMSGVKSYRTKNVAECAAKKKCIIYEKILEENYILLNFAVETIGPWCLEEINFINTVGTLISSKTGESKATIYLKRRISLDIQISIPACSLMIVKG